MMKVNQVICQNDAQSSVKKHISFCACAKSCDLLMLP